MFTLYSADFIGNPGNCSYPHKTVVMDANSMRAAVSHDYVCAEYKNHYRNSDNFLSADCLPVDCDRQTCWRHFPECASLSITAVLISARKTVNRRGQSSM